MLSQGKEFHGLHINRARAILTKVMDYVHRANKNAPRVGEISPFWRGCSRAHPAVADAGTAPLGTRGEGELFGIARDAIPAMPEDQPCSPWQAGDVLGAPRGAGCRGTICLHPWASLPLQKFNNEKRQKKENRKTRHFCASSSPATGSSFVCIYQQCCFMSSSPTGIIFLKIPFPM